MEEPRFILLWRNPFDDLTVIGGQLEPLTDREADTAILRYLCANRDAGVEPEDIFKWRVLGEPVKHGKEFLDGPVS